MTPERRREIEERCQRATPGPWTFMETPPPSRVDHGWRAVASFGKWMIGVRLCSGFTKRTAEDRSRNLDFAAHARQDIPDLLSALAEAEGKLAQYRELFTEERKVRRHDSQSLTDAGIASVWFHVPYDAVAAIEEG